VRAAASRPKVRRFIRYALGSAVATLASAATFAVMYRTVHSGPRISSISAFVAGALINFVANRFWAWDRRGQPGLGRDLASYAVLAVATALAAAGATSATESYAPRVDAFAAHLALVVEASYFATYAAMFLVKFAVLDRVVFRSRAQVDKTTRA
jgi:putative flippase GtrA